MLLPDISPQTILILSFYLDENHIESSKILFTSSNGKKNWRWLSAYCHPDTFWGSSPSIPSCEIGHFLWPLTLWLRPQVYTLLFKIKFKSFLSRFKEPSQHLIAVRLQLCETDESMLGAVHLFDITSYHPTVSINLSLLLIYFKRLYFLEMLQAYSNTEQKVQSSHVPLPRTPASPESTGRHVCQKW